MTRWLFVTLTMTLLTGCSSVLPTSAEPEVDEKRNQLEGLVKEEVLRGRRLLAVFK